MNKTKFKTAQKLREARARAHLANSIVNKYTKGQTGAQLARFFGVSVSTIFNILRDANVTIRARGPAPMIA